MGERNDPSEQNEDEINHKDLIWKEFTVRAVEAANKAIEWLELEDIDRETCSEARMEEIYHYRWESTGDIVTSVLNFVWPEIESLAIKLGVPFLPEIGEIDGEQYEF